MLLWNPRPRWSQRSQRIQKALWTMPMRNFGNDWVDDRCSCRQLQHGPRWSTSGISIPKKMPTRNVPQRDVHPYSRFQIRGKGKQSKITTFTVLPLIPRHAICRNKFLVSFYRSSSCFDWFSSSTISAAPLFNPWGRMSERQAAPKEMFEKR